MDIGRSKALSLYIYLFLLGSPFKNGQKFLDTLLMILKRHLFLNRRANRRFSSVRIMEFFFYLDFFFFSSPYNLSFCSIFHRFLSMHDNTDIRQYNCKHKNNQDTGYKIDLDILYFNDDSCSILKSGL